MQLKFNLRRKEKNIMFYIIMQYDFNRFLCILRARDNLRYSQFKQLHIKH